MALDEDMDFFVRDCYAEPGGPTDISSESLDRIDEQDDEYRRAKRQYDQPSPSASVPSQNSGSQSVGARSGKGGAPPSVDRLQLIEKG